MRPLVVASMLFVVACATPAREAVDRSISPSASPNTSVTASTSLAPSSTTPTPAASSGAQAARPGPPPNCHNPAMTITPTSGRIEDRISFTGECFDARALRGTHLAGYGISLVRRFDDCELIAATEHSITIDSQGRGKGWFEIPSSGSCFQGDEDRVVAPGTYVVIAQCHACDTGARFRVRS